MRRVGITGGIGSGKSTVCRILGVLGVPVFEADAEGRRLLSEDPDVIAAVRKHFGPDLIGQQGVDRKALAEIVFKDAAALKELNAIVHPAVRKAFARWAEAQEAPYMVLEAAVLAESGGRSQVDELWVVSAPEDLRIQRVMARDGVVEEAVRARMANQLPDAEREALADAVLVNDERQLLIPQVLALHEQMIRSSE